MDRLKIMWCTSKLQSFDNLLILELISDDLITKIGKQKDIGNNPIQLREQVFKF